MAQRQRTRAWIGGILSSQGEKPCTVSSKFDDDGRRTTVTHRRRPSPHPDIPASFGKWYSLSSRATRRTHRRSRAPAAPPHGAPAGATHHSPPHGSSTHLTGAPPCGHGLPSCGERRPTPWHRTWRRRHGPGPDWGRSSICRSYNILPSAHTPWGCGHGGRPAPRWPCFCWHRPARGNCPFRC